MIGAGGEDLAARSCPSAPATAGASLLGILGADGKIHNLRTKLQVDQAFLETAGDKVEARMRFTNRCETSGCMQWTGSRCGVIDRAMTMLSEPIAAKLPACTIRATCRWFDQTGPSACSTCAYIVTDTR